MDLATIETMDEGLKALWVYELFTLPGGSAITVGRLVVAIGLLIAGYLVSRLIGYLLAKRLKSTSMRPDAVEAIRRIVFYLVLVVVFLTALSVLQIPLTAFAFVTGAVAIGVGFGAQNIINNFISGWILMAERPVRIDDVIEIDGVYGTVERIGNRSTRVKRIDGVHMMVPNSALLERTVVNWTLIDFNIRSSIRVGVAYGSPVREVYDIIQRAAAEQSEVKSEPAPVVVFEDFGDNALIFDLFIWCEVGGRELRRVRSDIRFRLLEYFEEAGIVVAFPQRDVHLHVPAPIPVETRQATDENRGT